MKNNFLKASLLSFLPLVTGCDSESGPTYTALRHAGVSDSGAACVAQVVREQSYLFGEKPEIMVNNLSGDNMLEKGEPMVGILSEEGLLVQLRADGEDFLFPEDVSIKNLAASDLITSLKKCNQDKDCVEGVVKERRYLFGGSGHVEIFSLANSEKTPFGNIVLKVNGANGVMASITVSRTGKNLGLFESPENVNVNVLVADHTLAPLSDCRGEVMPSFSNNQRAPELKDIRKRLLEKQQQQLLLKNSI